MSEAMKKVLSGEYNLSGLDFEGQSFVGMDLKDRSFEFSRLCNADFKGADLRNASFLGADLSGANLAGSDLSGAIFSGANIRRATFEDCKKNGTVFLAAFVNHSDYSLQLFQEYQVSSGMLLLKDRDRKSSGPSAPAEIIVYSPEALKENLDELIAIAESLMTLAECELNELAKYKPNSDEQIENKKNQLAILEEFRDGFAKITKALKSLKEDPGRREEAQKVVNHVSRRLEKRWSELENWWGEDSARGFLTRSSISVGAISFFGWTGAPLTLVTPVVLGSVFGKQIIKSVKETPP